MHLALQLLKEGENVTVLLTPEMGFAEDGLRPHIPPYAHLVVDVKLFSVVQRAVAASAAPAATAAAAAAPSEASEAQEAPGPLWRWRGPPGAPCERYGAPALGSRFVRFFQLRWHRGFFEVQPNAQCAGPILGVCWRCSVPFEPGASFGPARAHVPAVITGGSKRAFPTQSTRCPKSSST